MGTQILYILLKQKQILPNNLEKELKILEERFENFDEEKFIAEFPEESRIIRHRALKKILPKYGIEYETNFSNLLKYDA